MKKVLVIGCPGGGKSTFARALAAKTGLPLHYLDMLYHRADRTTVPRAEFDAKLEEILQGDAWIIDGNYQRTLPRRLAACDTVCWLDYPTEVCLAGIEARFQKPRPDMPWVEMEHDPEFMAHIQAFQAQQKPKIAQLLAEVPEKTVYIFHSRAEGDEFLRGMETRNDEEGQT